MPDPTNTEVTTTTSEPGFTDALDSLHAVLMAMPESEVDRGLKLDVAVAAGTAEGTAAKLVAHRAALAAEWGEEAGALVDALPTIAAAARQADVAVHATPLSGDLSALHEAVRVEHQLLITDATALANRKLIDAQRLEPARDVQGYQNVLRSLLTLIFVLREQWSAIEEHTPLTKADLQRAEAVAKKLSSAINLRDNGVLRVPAVELRNRAGTKLVRTYEELRRKMSYLRWYQDDVDALIPSLWANRGRKARSNDADVDTDTDTDRQTDTDRDTDTDEPVTPTPRNGGPPFTS